MNSRAYISLECVKDNARFYQLLLPMGAPMKEAHGVILEFARDLLELEKKIEEQKAQSALSEQEKVPQDNNDAS